MCDMDIFKLNDCLKLLQLSVVKIAIGCYLFFKSLNAIITAKTLLPVLFLIITRCYVLFKENSELNRGCFFQNNSAVMLQSKQACTQNLGKMGF